MRSKPPWKSLSWPKLLVPLALARQAMGKTLVKSCTSGKPPSTPAPGPAAGQSSYACVPPTCIHALVLRTNSHTHQNSHSFGSALPYGLVDALPSASDGIILTGFSTNSSFVPLFHAGGNFVSANQNQPRLGPPTANTSPSKEVEAVLCHLFSASSANSALDAASASYTQQQSGPALNYAPGYITNSNIDGQQSQFFRPPFFDSKILQYAEATKQPVTVGETLTLGGLPALNSFAGPVLVITGCKIHPHSLTLFDLASFALSIYFYCALSPCSLHSRPYATRTSTWALHHSLKAKSML